MKTKIQHGTGEDISKKVCELLEDVNLANEEKDRFLALTQKTLMQCNERFGGNASYDFILKKHLSRLELKIIFSEDHFNPIQNIEKDSTDLKEKILSKLPNNRSTTSFVYYLAGKSFIAIRSPQFQDSKNFLKNPMFLAVILGIICGIICLNLPANVNAFIVNNLTTPIFSIYFRVMIGLMGPILFLSLIISISTMNSLRQLNTLGLRIIVRLVLITCVIMIVSAGFALLFFHHLTTGGPIVSMDNISDMVFSIIPTNLITPFTENNFAQIMILAFGLGAVALILGERIKKTLSIVEDVQLCLSTLWDFVRKLLPLIPFLGIFNLIASNKIDILISSWKFIVACYVVFTVGALYKLIKVSLRLKVNPMVLLRKLKAPMLSGLTTANLMVSMSMRREIAVKKLGIESSFSDFWMSMSMSFFYPSVPVYLILSVLFFSECYGLSVSLSFFAILALLTLQLSIASPGVAPSCSIVYEQLGIETGNVGLLSTSVLFVANYEMMCEILFHDLEQIEAAYVNHAIDLEKLRS